MPRFALLLLVALAGLPAWSQIFSIGVKAGVPFTTAYSATQDGSNSAVAYDRHYTIGPTAEVHLPFHLSVEVDALYRRNGFNYSGVSSVTLVSETFFDYRTAINDWQVPVLGKYEFTFGPLPIRPFVDAGVVYRHTSASGSGQNVVTPTNPNGVGVAVGGGIALKLLSIRISPEIRYTHWPTPPYTNGNLVLSSTKDQADFLVGITF